MKTLSKIIICLLIFLCHMVMAGTQCQQPTYQPKQFVIAGNKALEVHQTLNALNPQVALIARVGMDLHRYGLHYSHVGFVVRDYPGKPGKWTVIHLLNECGTNHSSIYAQGLMNFFMDDIQSPDYQITIPKPALQQKLYAQLKADKIYRYHNKRYNMLAYPFSTKYQNSNQWVLEVIAAANYPKTSQSRHGVQKILRKTGYKPTPIRLGVLTKLGASMFHHNIKFDDHPSRENLQHRYTTVTVRSIIEYLQLKHLILLNKSY